MTSVPASVRIPAWRTVVRSERIGAVKAAAAKSSARFWAEIAREGPPLVAEVPGDPDAADVTFPC